MWLIATATTTRLQHLSTRNDRWFKFCRLAQLSFCLRPTAIELLSDVITTQQHERYRRVIDRTGAATITRLLPFLSQLSSSAQAALCLIPRWLRRCFCRLLHHYPAVCSSNNNNNCHGSNKHELRHRLIVLLLFRFPVGNIVTGVQKQQRLMATHRLRGLPLIAAGRHRRPPLDHCSERRRLLLLLSSWGKRQWERIALQWRRQTAAVYGTAWARVWRPSRFSLWLSTQRSFTSAGYSRFYCCLRSENSLQLFLLPQNHWKFRHFEGIRAHGCIARNS